MDNEKRKCGSCSICCEIAEVRGNDFYKKPHRMCKFHKEGVGCTIFNDAKRPSMCHTFKCAWLMGLGEENDNPHINKVMVSLNEFNGGRWIFVIDVEKNAHLTTGKNIILDMIDKYHLPVIISDSESRFPNDKGDYVIIHKNLENRSKYIMGEFISKFSEDANVYKLIIS